MTDTITRDDLVSSFREITGDAVERGQEMRNTLAAVGGGIAIVLLIIVFLAGRRSGKKKTTVVEIKRV